MRTLPPHDLFLSSVRETFPSHGFALHDLLGLVYWADGFDYLAYGGFDRFHDRQIIIS